MTILIRDGNAWKKCDKRGRLGDGGFMTREANAPVHLVNAIW